MRQVAIETLIIHDIQNDLAGDLINGLGFGVGGRAQFSRSPGLRALGIGK